MIINKIKIGSKVVLKDTNQTYDVVGILHHQYNNNYDGETIYFLYGFDSPNLIPAIESQIDLYS